MGRCTLEVAGESVVAATGGALEAEYALFDPSDIELSASGPGYIREAGYRTTVGEAKQRLQTAGVTRALADEAAAAAKPDVAKAYARGAAVRRIAEHFEAAEMFDGQVYDASVGGYVGLWLDLPALAAAVAGRVPVTLSAAAVGLLFQALHLSALLEERAEDEPVAMLTGDFTAERRPGERTFRRVSFPEPAPIIEALRALPLERKSDDAGPGRQEIVHWLRARARRVPSAAARCESMHAALAARSLPARGPLADAELWAVESKLSLGETDGVLDQVEAIERKRGRLPATAYLRARVALMARTDEPRVIAERVSSLSTSMGAFHELQLLAAQAWVAAGDVRRAHAFARDLSENTSASDSLRMNAREVLDTAVRATTAPEGGVPIIPKPPLNPSRTDLHAQSSTAGDVRVAPAARTEPAPTRALVAGADLSLPSLRIELPDEGQPVGVEQGLLDLGPESVERLSLLPGMRDEAPPHDEPPRTPSAARLTCTFLARELGRELRIRHGLELRSDPNGLEIAQRYLAETFPVGGAPADEQREIMRYGSFVSELLARRLGARWVDLATADAGHWAMIVPSRSRAPSVCRVWPIGRVLRFVVQRHRERDLVSYYLELEAFAR